MSSSIQYASFLVRLWRETAADARPPTADWHGEVEHIQTGERWPFDTLGELLNLLRQGTEDPEIIRSATDGWD
jgi:hypothetical protein